MLLEKHRVRLVREISCLKKQLSVLLTGLRSLEKKTTSMSFVDLVSEVQAFMEIFIRVDDGAVAKAQVFLEKVKKHKALTDIISDRACLEYAKSLIKNSIDILISIEPKCRAIYLLKENKKKIFLEIKKQQESISDKELQRELIAKLRSDMSLLFEDLFDDCQQLVLLVEIDSLLKENIHRIFQHIIMYVDLVAVSLKLGWSPVFQLTEIIYSQFDSSAQVLKEEDSDRGTCFQWFDDFLKKSIQSEMNKAHPLLRRSLDMTKRNAEYSFSRVDAHIAMMKCQGVDDQESLMVLEAHFHNILNSLKSSLAACLPYYPHFPTGQQKIENIVNRFKVLRQDSCKNCIKRPLDYEFKSLEKRVAFVVLDGEEYGIEYPSFFMEILKLLEGCDAGMEDRCCMVDQYKKNCKDPHELNILRSILVSDQKRLDVFRVSKSHIIKVINLLMGTIIKPVGFELLIEQYSDLVESLNAALEDTIFFDCLGSRLFQVKEFFFWDYDSRKSEMIKKNKQGSVLHKDGFIPYQSGELSQCLVQTGERWPDVYCTFFEAESASIHSIFDLTITVEQVVAACKAAEKKSGVKAALVLLQDFQRWARFHHHKAESSMQLLGYERMLKIRISDVDSEDLSSESDRSSFSRDAFLV